MGAKIAKRSTNRDQIFPNFFWIFVFSIFTKLLFQIFEILYFSNFMKLWNLTWESMENHKMWNILKMADRRAKRMKIWDLRSQKINMQGTFQVKSFKFSLGSFGALRKISNAKISKGHCSHGFHPISTKIYGKHGNQGGIQVITFFDDLPKLNILCHFEIFVNTGPYGAGNFKTLLLLQFSSNVNQTLWEDIGNHGRMQAVSFLGNCQI